MLPAARPPRRRRRRQGLRVRPGQFLALDEGELERLRPARDRALALELCLDLSAIDPLLFSGRSLYLLPAGPAARPAYAVLAQALRQRRQGALGRLVLAGRRHLALVRPAASLLVLHLLHYPAQVRGGAALEGGLRPGPVGETEARLAGLLLDAYTRPPRWADYHDASARLLAGLVEARLREGPPEGAAAAPEEGPVLGLLDALRQSVAALDTAPPAPDPAPARRPGGGPSARRKSP